MSAMVFGMYRFFKVHQTNDEKFIRVTQLSGIIVHLDEVLTMSARMGAATGDIRWEKRYRKYETELEEAIKEAISMVPEAYEDKAANQTDKANVKLVSMENQAFALARRGKKREARKILFSPDYETQKIIYAKGMQHFTDSLRIKLDAESLELQRKMLHFFVVFFILLPLLIISWIRVIKLIKMWQETLLKNNHQLVQQSQELKSLNSTLDQRVIERTKALQDSESKMRAVFENAGGGIFVLNAETGTILDCNYHAEQLLGCPRQEIIGLNESALISTVEGEKHRTLFRNHAHDDMKTGFDTEIQRKNGKKVPVWVSMKPMKIGNQNHIIGLLMDMTEKKEMEERVLQSEKLSSVGQLAAGVAHEINNPIGVILGFAQLVVGRIEKDNRFARPLKTIEQEALRCKTLVQDLLFFTRAGKSETREMVNLQDVIVRSISLVSTRTKASDIEILTHFSPEISPIKGNRNQLQQVIINLANNAVDAMPDGGKLTLSVQPSEKREGCIELRVHDTGQGIPEEIQAKIFEPFFTTKDVGKGTGLGLSLVYEILQKHGGSLDLTSDVGRGTEFIIYLPQGETPSNA